MRQRENGIEVVAFKGHWLVTIIYGHTGVWLMLAIRDSYLATLDSNGTSTSGGLQISLLAYILKLVVTSLGYRSSVEAPSGLLTDIG